MPIRDSQGNITGWLNADGSIVPYSGQDGGTTSPSTFYGSRGQFESGVTQTAATGGGTGGAAPVSGGAIDWSNPQPGQTYTAPNGQTYIVVGVDASGQPQFMDISPSSGRTVVIGGKLVDSATGQVIADFSQSGTGTTPYQNATLGLQRQQLDETIREFNEKFGFDKAKFNTQFPLDQAGVTGYYQGAPTLGREQFGEGQRQFDTGTALDYYKYLGQMAANPRNYIQTFLTLRGQEAPAGSERFGSAPPLSAIQPFEQFLPSFLRQAGAFSSAASPYGYGARGGTVASAEPAAAVAQTAAPPTLETAFGPDVRKNIAANVATFRTPEQEAAVQQSTSQNIWNAPGVVMTPADEEARKMGKTPKAVGPGGTLTYAKGGIIPEPVVGVGMDSGRPYSFGEMGPEGVIPAHLLPNFLRKRGGTGSYAYGGTIGFDGGNLYGDGANDEPPPPGSYEYAGPAFGLYPQTSEQYYVNELIDEQSQRMPESTTTAPSTQTVTRTPTTTTTTAPAVTGGGAAGSAGGGGAGTQTGFGISAAQQAAIDAEIARVAELNRLKNLPPIGGPGTAGPDGDPPPPPPPGTTTGPGGAPVQIPGFVPQNGTTSAPAPAGTPTFRDVSPAGTFGAQVGTSQRTSARPQFLPGEDQMNPLVQMLLQSNVFPPFLARLFAQEKGVQEFGTNTPNPVNLPPGVPLSSSLGWSQMTPSEQQGLLSYISALGVDPQDYLALIQQFSPRGPISRAPEFGSRLAPFFQ